MKISFNKLEKEYKRNKSLFNRTIQKVLNSGSFVLGEEVEKFEKSFSKYLGVKFAIGVGNGTEAIQISLLSLGISKGDEVITTSLSAGATGLAIEAVGAKPVFVDIDDCFHIDVKKIERKITKKTKAIIPVHLYGQSVDIENIKKICRKHNLFLIEDCAQAQGTTFNGKKVGSFGDLGCFSFYPTKNLGAFGDGGAIVTNNSYLAKRCKMIRNYGQKNRYEHLIFGINSRLDELQAAILSIKLRYLDEYNLIRIKNAKKYYKYLSGINNIKLPNLRRQSNHIYHLFVIEVENRKELMKYLSKNGIQTIIHYPIPLHKQPCFEKFNKVKLPVVEEKANKILSLPINPFLTEKEIKFISKNIKEFYKRN